jgi:pilus assembly protein CpaE
MQGKTQAPVRVAAVGGSAELARLCAALSSAQEIELVACGYAEHLDSPVDAVVLEARHESTLEDDLEVLRLVTSAPVICLLTDPSTALVERALDSGIADVLRHPCDAGGVLFAIEKVVRATRRQGHARAGRLVTVFSPKGGTGKSVIATNLAAGVARRGGQRTLLVDLDLQFGDDAIMLGLSPRSTLRELFASPGAIDAERLDTYRERHSSGLDVLAAPLRPEEAELIGDDAVRAALELARTSYDVVVADTAPSFHGSTLASLDLTDELLLVCTPDIPTAKNVRLALETLQLLAFPAARTRVVLNRHGEQGGLRTEEVEEALGYYVEFVLPFDPAVPRGVNRGAPAVLDAARGPFATALGELAASLVGVVTQTAAKPAPANAPRRQRHRLLALAGR